MGNMCINNDCINNALINFKHTFNHKRDPVRCVKCGDYFKVHCGGKSQRTSCRDHNWVKREYKLIDDTVWCKTCDRIKPKYGCHNCYHCCYYE